jgi:hypothetical protein
MQRGRSKKTTGDHCCSSLWFFAVHELRFGGAVGEGHVLQFALAARIAHRTIQRMIPSSSSSIDFRACLISSLSEVTIMPSLITVVHAVCSFGIFSIFDQAHAASALQRQVGVVAERGDLDAHGLAGLNEQRPRRGRDLLAVHCKCHISHKVLSVN